MSKNSWAKKSEKDKNTILQRRTETFKNRPGFKKEIENEKL